MSVDSSDEIQTVVVGAGVVGLAIARALAMSGRDVLIVEADTTIGAATSSRNSEVVHAGIYYPAGSLKANLCVRGREMLYRYMTDNEVPHQRIGKLIVATADGQREDLERIRGRAEANGVDDLRRVDAGELVRMEPELTACEGLLSPSTGILDSHALMRSLFRDAVEAGAVAAFGSSVVSGEAHADRIVVRIGGDDSETSTLTCREVVNSAGLGAWGVARAMSGYPAPSIPPSHLAKGNYFTLASGRAPFSRLIYPVPADGGLGVHLTLDLGGQARFGPDVEWIEPGVADPLDYAVDPVRGERFYSEIRRYWPGLPDDSLTPGYAGIRPKVSGPGEPAADFVIAGPADHGVPGMVNLFGVESPGLTSSLAIADHVTALLDAH